MNCRPIVTLRRQPEQQIGDVGPAVRVKRLRIEEGEVRIAGEAHARPAEEEEPGREQREISPALADDARRRRLSRRGRPRAPVKLLVT